MNAHPDGVLAADTFLAPSWSAGGIVASVVGVGLYLWMVLWVVRDAERRGDSGSLWGLATFVFGPLAWLFYLARRRPAVV